MKLFSLLLIFSSLFAYGASPEEIFLKLQQGNQRFAGGQSVHPRREFSHRELLSSSQEPSAIILSCSDSRVPPEILFDQGVGDLFIVRVAGNVVGQIEMESIEFGALALHASVIIVLGHENCGAIDAVLKGKTQDIKAIASLIQPAITKESSLENAIKANVSHVVKQLKTHPLLGRLVEEKKLMVVGGYYNLSSGTVTFL